MLSLLTFSQIDTSKYTYIPKEYLKKAARDLVKYDECKEKLATLGSNIDFLTYRIELKEAEVSKLERVIVNLNMVVSNDSAIVQAKDDAIVSYEGVVKNKDKRISQLEANIKWQKVKQAGLLVAIAGLAVKVFILK